MVHTIHRGMRTPFGLSPEGPRARIPPMVARGHRVWVERLAWVLVALAGAGWLAHSRLLALEEAFLTDARIVHRLLSQRAVQHDAVMAMLPLLQQPPAAGSEAASMPQLPSAYPQILDVLRRPPSGTWPTRWSDALRMQVQDAAARSRQSGHAELAQADLAGGRVWLALAGPSSHPADFAMLLDLRAAVPWEEWPMASTSPVRVQLAYQEQRFVVQTGQRDTWGWHHAFRKPLATQSQPFDVVLERDVGWGELPWAYMLAWGLASYAVMVALRAAWRQRVTARRSEDLLRVGQVARLNQLGELAAGMAHELNQPLTALLANTQAAQRLLEDDNEPDLATARHAMRQAVDQARRANAVVGRLRRVVERPDLSVQTRPLNLAAEKHRSTGGRTSELARGVGRACGLAANHPQPGDECLASTGTSRRHSAALMVAFACARRASGAQRARQRRWCA